MGKELGVVVVLVLVAAGCVRGGSCPEYYEGDDCTLYNQPVESGERVMGTVDEYKWKYYNLEVVSSGTGLKWEVTLASGGEVELYLQQGRFPTERSYLARNISTGRVLTVQKSDLRAGRYYAGVRGYFGRGISFRLVGTVEGECGKGCGEHGTCIQGECLCKEGWSGEHCGFSLTEVDPGTVYHGNLEDRGWAYFAYEPAVVLERMTWTVTTGEASNVDCDIYLKAGERPGRFNWDQRNVSVSATNTIIQDEVIVDVWYYLGVYNFANCPYFTLELDVALPNSPTQCENDCSWHAVSCHASRCLCTPGYSGTVCEHSSIPLPYGTYVTGYVGHGVWNYYPLHTATATGVVIALSQVDVDGKPDASGDCDIFVRAGERPTLTDFDFVNIDLAPEMQLTIPAPGDNDWYVGVYGWSPSGYMLNVTQTIACGCASANVGFCEPNSALCVCHEGYAGERCNAHVQYLDRPATLRQESVKRGEWQYYEVEVSSSSAVSVTVKEKGSTGFVWTYVSLHEYPTLHTSLSSHTTGELHDIFTTVDPPFSGTFYVGVYGSPNMPDDHEREAQFDMALWFSDF
eukprot:CAMPEP_0119122624 /NCGR_PEP_ID=MMETSP1310-20130426/2823_1 /TAXON_ID=464262 /ORGANISM="Genus nov. species nov., Strain RCC2339" /LENGTH=572 /DNA_ID=CAMNT_0007112305 /DNA_START=90 /DNA_END=1808 /DNA_ORIENTATION=+